MLSGFKLKNLRWLIAGLLFLNTVNNYINRQALSIIVPRLTRELGITNVQYGYITQAFLIAYTAMYFISGLLIDRWGVKLVNGIATAWWALAALLHATVRSAVGLGCFQFLLGAGESPNFIAAQKVSGEWYSAKERGTVNGLVQAGAVTGAIITPPMIVLLMTYIGWRAAFLVTGSLGILWVIAWWALYSAPETHPLITSEELAIIRNESSASPRPTVKSVRWVDLLRMRETWGLLVARIFSDPVWWFYVFWLPKYLTDARGFSLRLIGLIAWVPYLFSDTGALIGGFLSGCLVARGWRVVRARKAVMFCSMLLMPLGAIIAFTPSATLAVATICLVLFAHMSWKTNLATLNVDLYPKQILASAAGLVAMGSSAGGAVFTMIAGYLIHGQSYTAVFLIMAVLHPIAYLIVHWTIRDRAADQGPVIRDTTTVAGRHNGT